MAQLFELQVEAEREQKIKEDVTLIKRTFYCEVKVMISILIPYGPKSSPPINALQALKIPD